jgi:hypothetical protein
MAARMGRRSHRAVSRWACLLLLLLAAVMLSEPTTVSADSKKKSKSKPAPDLSSPCSVRPPQLLWMQNVDRVPMTLDAFPRPPGDTGRGIHWVPTTSQSPDEVDRLLDEARAMRISWITFLNDGTAIGPNNYLVEQAVAHGIEPIMRVYTPNGQPIAGTPDDLAAMVHHYRQLGVRYFQLYNEPNNNGENVDGRPHVDRYVTQWSDAARVVIMQGGYPGIGALSPGGDSDDLRFLADVLDTLAQRGQLHLLDCAWLALHNYSFNRPIDYIGDQHSYLSFRTYHVIIMLRLGRAMPIIGTEGGTHVGSAFDPAYPAVDAARHTALVLDAYRYMERPEREPYYFAFSYWIIADEIETASLLVSSPPPLFQEDTTLPLVAQLKRKPAPVPKLAMIGTSSTPPKQRTTTPAPRDARPAPILPARRSGPITGRWRPVPW